MTSTALTSSAGLSFTGRNPDVLTCIANLSNDEVFTPPELANQMLDLVAEAWAASNDGASIWADPTVTFLDPATKSGVFLREITKRLVDGLAEAIPDLQERVDHILTAQVFGIGITELTAMLARRSLYCSKHAKRTEEHPHSIATGFDHDDGNVWFERTEHEWVKGRCRFCAARAASMDRGDDLETHAYAFIHADDITTRVKELFGDNMQFDVIIGNPPYQMTGGGGGGGHSPLYNLFVENARRLSPRYIAMVIPSRWMAGGRGLEGFRTTMLGDRHLSHLFDFPNSLDVFPSVDIRGGACYFLWDAGHHGDCAVTLVRGTNCFGPEVRKLDEYDIFVRDSRSLSILRKIQDKNEAVMSALVTGAVPFGLTSNHPLGTYTGDIADGELVVHAVSSGKRIRGSIGRSDITKHTELIDVWKVLVPKAGSGGQEVPDSVIGKPLLASPGSISTETFLPVGDLRTELEASSLQSYLTTKICRFLISLRKVSQDTMRGVYEWVPQQSWDRIWTDEELYAKYKLTKAEIAYIESMIRPMELADD